MQSDPFDADAQPADPAPRGAPHLRQRGMRTEPCRYGQCDGSGWIEVEETNGARECSCRRERVAAARAARLATSIPRRYLDVDFDRWPITNLDQKIVSFVKKYCRRLEKNIDEGAGLYFYGEVGSGKTSLAMVVAKEVLRERRSLAIFSGPDLLAKIVSTYEDRSPDTYLGLMELLGSVDFLILEDLAVAKQSEWRLEQLYAVINRRYQDRRPLLITADVGAPELLGEHIGPRTGSRILEMCEAIPFLDGDHRVKATTPEDVRLAS
jgi:DNA replication protein DnaC